MFLLVADRHYSIVPNAIVFVLCCVLTAQFFHSLEIEYCYCYCLKLIMVLLLLLGATVLFLLFKSVTAVLLLLATTSVLFLLPVRIALFLLPKFSHAAAVTAWNDKVFCVAW